MSHSLLVDGDSSEVGNRTLPGRRTAPWHNVPALSITCVEHPFVVKNVSRALETLGGPQKARLLVGRDSVSMEANLFLHPDDRMSKPIPSNNMATNNILLRVMLPKRTGRKRKRGSQTPFQDHPNEPTIQPGKTGTPIYSAGSIPSRDARYLMQGLRDNVGKSEFLPFGTIEQTHRFRSMPDFLWSTSKSPFMSKIKETILPMKYNKLKDFKLDLSKGQNVNADLLPPPTLTHFPLPFNYAYQQNPAMQQVLDNDGQVAIVNTQVPRKISTQLLAANVENIPNGPSPDTPPFDSLDPDMKRIIQKVHVLLDERPIWTRRALQNQLDASDWRKIGRYVFQHTGYMFRSGPWRDALVKFGIDPRTDPKYRIYQTLMFQIEAAGNYAKPKRTGTTREDSLWGGSRKWRSREHQITSHIFDGICLPTEGKVFQVCDITDHIIQSILTTTHIREKCDLQNDGWYFNGTWAKAKVIMKARMNHIASGRGTLLDADYAPLLTIPDILDQSTRHLAIFKKAKVKSEIVELATLIRGFANRSNFLAEDRSMHGPETSQRREDISIDQEIKETMLQLDSGNEELRDIGFVESSGDEIDESSSMISSEDDMGMSDEESGGSDVDLNGDGDDARNDDLEDEDEREKIEALLFDRKPKTGP